MAYAPQTWTNNDPATPLSASRLNYLGPGVAGSAVDAEVMKLAGTQTVTGAKTFNAPITSAYQPRKVTQGNALPTTDVVNGDVHFLTP